MLLQNNRMPLEMVFNGEDFSFTWIFCPESLQAFLKHICTYVCVYILYTHKHTATCHKANLNKYLCCLYNRLPTIFTSQVSLCLHVFMHTHRLCTCGHLCDQSAKFFRVSSELSSCLPSLKQHCWAWVFCCGFLPISCPPILPSPSRVKAFFPHKLMHCSIKQTFSFQFTFCNPDRSRYNSFKK